MTNIFVCSGIFWIIKSIKKAPKYNKNEIIFGIISLSFEW